MQIEGIKALPGMYLEDGLTRESRTLDEGGTDSQSVIKVIGLPAKRKILT
jgi:hypothetical protein